MSVLSLSLSFFFFLNQTFVFCQSILYPHSISLETKPSPALIDLILDPQQFSPITPHMNVKVPCAHTTLLSPRVCVCVCVEYSFLCNRFFFGRVCLSCFTLSRLSTCTSKKPNDDLSNVVIQQLVVDPIGSTIYVLQQSSI